MADGINDATVYQAFFHSRTPMKQHMLVVTQEILCFLW